MNIKVDELSERGVRVGAGEQDGTEENQAHHILSLLLFVLFFVTFPVKLISRPE